MAMTVYVSAVLQLKFCMTMNGHSPTPNSEYSNVDL